MIIRDAWTSWMKLEDDCIQLCQGGVSTWYTDKPCMVDSVPDHVVVMTFQKHVTLVPVVVPEPQQKMLVITNIIQ